MNQEKEVILKAFNALYDKFRESKKNHYHKGSKKSFARAISFSEGSISSTLLGTGYPVQADRVLSAAHKLGVSMSIKVDEKGEYSFTIE